MNIASWFLVLGILIAAVYCGGIPANANVVLVDENDDPLDRANIVAACPTCTFTEVVSVDYSFFNNPIDPAYDMLIFLKSDDDMDAYVPDNLTWQATIEAFANLGRVVLFTQYDMLASNQDDILIDIVGGVSSLDCSGYSGTIPDPFPTNVPECDLILNGGFFDLRGLTPGVDIDPNWGVGSFPGDLDCEVLNPGISFACLTSTLYDPVDNVIWAVRPMTNQGAVVWLSIDDDDDLSWYTNPTSVYYFALNNLLSFAEAVAGGDPHITTFENERFDLTGENIYNLFRDSNLAINAHTTSYFTGAFIDQVGILFDNHRVLAIGSGELLKFFVDDVEISVGSAVLDDMVRVSEYIFHPHDELARYLTTSLRVFFNGYTVEVDGGFVKGSNNQKIPFFNVLLKEHHLDSDLLTRDVTNLGIFQIHSVNQLREISDSSRFTDFVVTDLFAN